MPWSLIKVPFYYMTAVKNAIKRLMLPYLISHLNMRISSNARIPPSGYMQNIFGVQSNTIALLFILRMDLTPSIRSGHGYRIRVNGNNVSWIKSAQPDTSYDSLKDYLRIVFSYAGTASMDTEAQPIPLSDLQVGDVFLKGGNPGHVVMVVDLCENADGKEAFLLAQGYMPAQQFHVLNNPAHEDDPWYYEDEVTYPFHTPEYTFQKGSLKRLNYGITHTAPE